MYQGYDETAKSEEIAVERPDPRVDLMRQFTDVDRAIRDLEQMTAEHNKRLAKMREERETLRNRIGQAIAPDNAVSAEDALAPLRRRGLGE